MAYRHGFRASELIALRWDQVDLKARTLHVAWLKHGSARYTRGGGQPIQRLLEGLTGARFSDNDARLPLYSRLALFCDGHHVRRNGRMPPLT